MKAEALISRRVTISQRVFTEIALWRVPSPLKGSAHAYKYRFALVVDEVCVLRYDNESGKGDHKHIGNRQMPYRFSNVDALMEDFGSDVRKWLDENGRV